MFRKNIMSKLHVLFNRIQLWRQIPNMLTLKFEKLGFENLKENSIRVK